MEMIYTDSDLVDVGIYRGDLDFEYGDSSMKNNYEITTDLLTAGSAIYCHNTAIGGIVEYTDTTNTGETPVVRGFSLYGLLMYDIIEAPSGSDNLQLTGDLNDIIRTVVSDTLDGFFTVPNILAGKSVTHKFPRHEKVGKALMDMLEDYGYRLDAKWVKTAGEPVKAVLQALPAQVISGTFTEDNAVPIRFVWNHMGTNHMICLGKGEGQARQRIDLYLQQDGTISKTVKGYTGFHERKETYENSQAETLDDLEKGGRERLKDHATGSTMSINEDGLTGIYNIGDIIQAKSIEHDGITIKKRISGIILKIKSGSVSIQYKVED